MTMAHQSAFDAAELAAHNSLRRPYFSLVSQREFSEVLNGKNFSIQPTSYPNAATKERINSRDILKHHDQSGNRVKTPVKLPLVSEDDFVALSLQALQGIASFIYNSDTIRQKQLHICNFILLGRSATSLSKYQLAFSESYYIRLLVGSAQEAFSTLSSDRGQLAFGAALGDLLLLHDASISTLKEKLHNEGRVSLSSLWTSVALHRSILSQLFRIIASTELLEAFQRVFHTSQHNSPKENIDEKMNQYALLDLLVARYINVQSWMSSNSNSNNVGWVILDSLLVHLEKARKMTSSLSVHSSRSSFSLMEREREMTMESRCHGIINLKRSSSSSLSAEVKSEEVVSDSLAKVIVILFLVKRVSLPLLERLQRRLLCLESDYETATPTVSQAVIENVPGIISKNILSNISIYHGDRKRRESIKNGDVILFPPDIKASPRHSHTNSNQLELQSPLRSSTGSPLKYKRTSSTGSTSTCDEGAMTWDNNNTNHNHNHNVAGEGEEEDEGMVLQGTVVPSLLLALERAINPIRLICHGSQVTHSSMLGFSNSSNDIPIYGKEVIHGTGLYGQSQGESSVWTANCLKRENEEADKKSVRDNDVLRACRDTGARLLIPLNTADLDGLQLLVNSAIGRFTAIRAAVLSEINAWTNPEPLHIDHKALQLKMNLKFKKRGRIKIKDPMNSEASLAPGEGLEGGEVLSLGPVSEAAVAASEAISSPQTVDIILAVAEVSDATIISAAVEKEGSTIGAVKGPLGDGVDADSDADVDARALAVLSALSTIALNTADSEDGNPINVKISTDILSAAAASNASKGDSSSDSNSGAGDDALVSTLPSTSPAPDAGAGLHLTNGGAVFGPFGDAHTLMTQSANGNGMGLHAAVAVANAEDRLEVEKEIEFRIKVGVGEGDNHNIIEGTDSATMGLTDPSKTNRTKVTSDVSALDLGGLEGDLDSCEVLCEVAIAASPHSTTYEHPFPVVPPAPLGASQRTDLSSLGYQMIIPDMRSINREMRFRETATSTFSKGLILLAEANGIVFNPRSTSSSFSSSSSSSSSSSTAKRDTKNSKVSLAQVEDEDNALMLLMQPMQAILDGTLLSAVSWQCRVLDQAALFASMTSPSLIRNAHTDFDTMAESRGIGRIQGRKDKCSTQSLLWHIDSFESSFLLSSKSDVISSLVAIVIETYAHRHPFLHSQSVSSTQRSRYLSSIRRKSMQSSVALMNGDEDGDVANTRMRSTSSSVYTVESTANSLDLWTQFSLTAALSKLKNQRVETAHSLTYVQYTIKPPRRSYHHNDGDGDGADDMSHHAASSSASSGPSSDSIFSAYGLDRLSLSYTAAWPIDTMITPALLLVTARSTRRLIELAQLTALVRFVWVDTRGRGRKNCSAVVVKNSGVSRASKGVAPTPKGSSSHSHSSSFFSSSSSSSSSSSRAVFDRDCAHALRIVQQTLLPLSDFTSDRIKSQQIKFRTDVLDSSNHGFPGLKRAFMRYAQAVALSIFANCDNDEVDDNDDGVRDKDGDGENNSNDREKGYSRVGTGRGAGRERRMVVDDRETVSDDFSIAELISRVLSACRDVLIMLEMSSIQESEENQKTNSASAALPLESSSYPGPKQTQMLSKIKECMTVLLQRRVELFLTSKRVAEDEDQQDALALLMFFNQ